MMVLFFNVLHFFPPNISEFFFWSFFLLLGLFYSWPTRGKIIEESMASQFSEYRFLDSFERTVLALITVLFLTSVPEISLFQNIDALKLYFDPQEAIHFSIWNFLTVNYLPFKNYPNLYNLSWSYHFYFYGIGMFLLAFYCVLRYFFSRRLSILGVFAIISTWSFSKILNADLMASFTTTYTLIWVWSIMWSTKSLTYRSGLVVGLTMALGVMIDIHYIYLLPVTLICVYKLFLKEQTTWYKNQWLKYNTMGVIIILGVLLSQFEVGKVFSGITFFELGGIIFDLIYRKAFFALSALGVLLLAGLYSAKLKSRFSVFIIDKSKLNEFLILSSILVIFSLLFHRIYIQSFTAIWLLAFLSLIPLEWIFQSISRLRSKRNLIFALYILVCLLDSHFEGRLRIIGKMFLEDELFKYINQM